jgi:hypothetical protein
LGFQDGGEHYLQLADAWTALLVQRLHYPVQPGHLFAHCKSRFSASVIRLMANRWFPQRLIGVFPLGESPRID